MSTDDIMAITRHQELIRHPAVRQKLFAQFAPTFCFHKNEDNFPVDPEAAIENIITVKRAEYIAIRDRQRHNRALTSVEQAELAAIDQFFWVNNCFNPHYKTHQNNPDFIKLTANPAKDTPNFLIFDEKHYGYQVGEKINITGIAPKGHKYYDRNKNPAPLTASIIPTRDGFFIQYEYLYTLNNAIFGTQWLRRLLPEWLCQKFSNFGLHYGDAEKVGIHVKVDEHGVASLQAMQTWAHGRDFAQNVAAKNCTFDKNGRVCVFVGVSGHPSYAHNFVGRNIAMDLVGDAYKLEPTEFTKFIDVSADTTKLARDLTQQDVHPEDLAQHHPELVASARAMPGALSAFTRFADSNPLAHDEIKNQEALDKEFVGFNTYQPWLLLARLWNFIVRCCRRSSASRPALDFNLNEFVAKLKPEEWVKPNTEKNNSESESGHQLSLLVFPLLNKKTVAVPKDYYNDGLFGEKTTSPTNPSSSPKTGPSMTIK